VLLDSFLSLENTLFNKLQVLVRVASYAQLAAVPAIKTIHISTA
jgi:hypothetical protein